MVATEPEVQSRLFERLAQRTGARCTLFSMEKLEDGAVELDFRTSDGIDVALLWHRPTNTLSISVSDAKTGDRFAVPVRADAALDAFRHPYAYYGHGIVGRGRAALRRA